MAASIFADLPGKAAEELLTDLLVRPGIRIERIVSTGQSTPLGQAYDQAHDEWVLLLSGSAGLWRDGIGEETLNPGDHVMIPAHQRHRVTWTDANQPTVWLAIHLGEETAEA